MIKLKINRYNQKSGHCAVCSCASVANFYNKNINYKNTKKKARKIFKNNIDNGLYSGQIGILLNKLGFKKVNIVSSNLHYLDYTWRKLSKQKLIKKLKKQLKYFKKHKIFNCEKIGETKSLIKWLQQQKYDNKLIIDYNFGEYIRNFLAKRKPIVISFSWTIYFKDIKVTKQDVEDDIKGEEDEHAVVIYGYTKDKVFISDSNNEIYEDGLYTMSWENLMTVLNMGDIYLPYDYE
ncbi:MAG: C39 family peptidase [bacterium]